MRFEAASSSTVRAPWSTLKGGHQQGLARRALPGGADVHGRLDGRHGVVDAGEHGDAVLHEAFGHGLGDRVGEGRETAPLVPVALVARTKPRSAPPQVDGSHLSALG